MSRLSRYNGAHAARSSSAQKGFVRRNLGVILVLGVVLAFAGPAAQASDGDPLLAGGTAFATNPTAVSTTIATGLIGATSDPYAYTFGLFGDKHRRG